MPAPAAVRQPERSGRDGAAARWFATPLAQQLLAEEQRQLLPVLAGCYGQVGLYLRGTAASSSRLSGNMMQSVLHLTRAVGPSGRLDGDLVCSADELPLARESVDLVYLLHALEGIKRPHALLAELERVLTPEGSVMVVGLNPLSLWRMRWAAAGVRANGSGECREWLRDAGFEVHQQRSLGPVWPWLRDGLMIGADSTRDAFVSMRAGYALLARKRRPGLTPLRARSAVTLKPGMGTG